MIQRVQSIFLFLIVVLMAAALFLPVWEKTNSYTLTDSKESVTIGEKATLTAWKLIHSKNEIKEEKSTYYIAALAILSALVAGYTIFRYDNRRIQLYLCIAIDLLLAGTSTAMIITGNSAASKFSPSIPGNFTTGLYLVIGALICNLIAKRFIRRDDMMVKSADRLR